MDWKFLPNPGDEEEGLGHAGIETFRGSPYPGIARECSQNSLDAAARLPDGSTIPVHVVFKLLELQSNEIPGLDSLKLTLSACLKQAQDRHLNKDEAFFRRALEISNKTYVPTLLIEDSGTTGLVGPAEPGTPFYALVKSSGVSQKDNLDASGSFGIGKNAAFAVSSLRTVFYSTLYNDTHDEVHLAQGKSMLVSHTGSDGAKKRATGYWGSDNYNPLVGSVDIPAWLTRSVIGTSVAVVGFRREPNWHWQMVESLIRNFFAAITEGAISFAVQASSDLQIEVNHQTLNTLLGNPEVHSASESAGSTEDLAFSSAMLATLTSPDAQVKEKSFEAVGKFRLRLLQKDGFPKRVGILRNGMYITDNLKHFGHLLARFNLSRDFAVTVEPADRETSGRIRDMEGPKHDEISADRIDDTSERNKLKRAMKEVGSWIRETIKEATTTPSEDEVLLDEMNRFFSKPGAVPPIPDPANQNNNPEQIKLTPKASQLPVPVGAGPEGASGSSGGSKDTNSHGGRTTGERRGKGRGSRGGRGGKSISFSALRNSVAASGQVTVRDISFTPDKSGPASLELSAVGVTSDEPLAVRSINGTPCSKTPIISLVAELRTHIKLELEAPYTGPIKLTLTPIEETQNAD